MKSNFIQDAVQKYLYEKSHPYQALNFNRCGYDEADVLAITKSNFVTEVEVKVSLSDFRADFKKTYKHFKMINSKGVDTYHSTPNRFYYACPSKLIPITMIPAYAGLIYVSEDGEIRIIKKAPLIHRDKCRNNLFITMLQNLTAKTIFGCQWMTYKNRPKI